MRKKDLTILECRDVRFISLERWYMFLRIFHRNIKINQKYIIHEIFLQYIKGLLIKLLY